MIASMERFDRRYLNRLARLADELEVGTISPSQCQDLAAGCRRMALALIMLADSVADGTVVALAGAVTDERGRR